MPAPDDCQEQVANSLRKARWEIDDKPYFLRTQGITLFIDIQARRRNQNIVIEVKCFSGQRSDQDEFYRAIGQYLVYRNALKRENVTNPLYMAIPITVYHRFFGKTVILDTVRESQIKLIVVDFDEEEVVE